MPAFDIIITVWNRLAYTRRTIGGLIASGAVDACDRLIIVDNRSTEEGMDEFLLTLWKDTPGVSAKVWLIRRGKNDGWGAAVNDALGCSRAPYVFVSNNDVDYQTDFHARMFETFAAHPDIGILGVWRHIGHGFFKGGIQDATFREMDNVPAVGWMMPKLAMEKVGLLNENGPCLERGGNGEDTTYVNRMREAGFRIGVTGEDVAKHIDGY